MPALEDPPVEPEDIDAPPRVLPEDAWSPEPDIDELPMDDVPPLLLIEPLLPWF